MFIYYLTILVLFKSRFRPEKKDSYPDDAVMKVQSQEASGNGVIFIEPLLDFTVNNAVNAGATFLVEPIRKEVPKS